jgi:hypothetical protein
VRTKPEYVLKDEASLKRKLAGKLAEGPAAGLAPPSAPRVVAGLNDTVRYTVIYPDASYAEQSVRTVEGLRGAGFDVVKAKSTWDGSRYRGLNVTLHDPASGRLFEVQTHTPESYRAGEDTRRSYELYRDVGIEPGYQRQLELEIGDRYRLVPTPPGVQDLPLLLERFDGGAAAQFTAPALARLDPRRAVQLTGVAGGVAAAGHQRLAPADGP